YRVLLFFLNQPESLMRIRLFTLLFMLAPLAAFAREDKGWPKQFEKDDYIIIMYQPQPESLKDNQLKTRMAISVTPEKSKTPTFGAVWFTCTLDIDRDDRMVKVDKIHVDKVKFPGATPEGEQKLTKFIEEEFPDLDLEMSLDRLIAAVDQTQ